MPGLRVEDRPEGVRWLTLEAPDRRNLLDGPMLEALDRALDAHPRAFCLQGTGNAFCAGYDLAGLAANVGEEGPLPDETLLAVLRKLSRHPSPSIAVVQGVAIGGGCDLAASCDFRIATDQATFWMPPARLGIIYNREGLQRLTALVGLSRAKWMFFTGRKVSAAQGHAWGFFDELHPTLEAAQKAADSLAGDLALAAPQALTGMKQSFTALQAVEIPPDVQKTLEALRRQAYRSEDIQEGRAALLEKRPPRFTGR